MKLRFGLALLMVLFTVTAFGQTRVRVVNTAGFLNATYTESYYCLKVNVLVTDSTQTEWLVSSAFVYIKKDRTDAEESFIKR